MLPGRRAQVVTAEDEMIEGKTIRLGEGLDEGAKAVWGQAGIAAKLIDLVAGRLDKDVRSAFQGGLQDPGMGRTNGGDAPSLPPPLSLNNLTQVG